MQLPQKISPARVYTILLSRSLWVLQLAFRGSVSLDKPESYPFYLQCCNRVRMEFVALGTPIPPKVPFPKKSIPTAFCSITKSCGHDRGRMPAAIEGAYGVLIVAEVCARGIYSPIFLPEGQPNYARRI